MDRKGGTGRRRGTGPDVGRGDRRALARSADPAGHPTVGLGAGRDGPPRGGRRMASVVGHPAVGRWGDTRPAEVRRGAGRLGGTHRVAARLAVDRIAATPACGHRAGGRIRHGPMAPDVADRPTVVAGPMARAARSDMGGPMAGEAHAQEPDRVHDRSVEAARCPGRAGRPVRVHRPTRAPRLRASVAGRRASVDQPRPLSTRRRQRWPSRVSSTAIPRSASSSRNRSELA